MIPSSGQIEAARREVKEELEARTSDSATYFEYEWFGETHSYTAAGYWGRILFVLAMTLFTAGILVLEGQAGVALVFALIMAGGISLSLVSLWWYRGSK